MKKVTKIIFLTEYKLHCFFNNGEERLLDVPAILKDKYAKKIMNEHIFKKAKVGDLGEIYWEGIGEIKQLDGSLTPCNYDMSPEFVYINSKPFKNNPTFQVAPKTA